MRRTKEGGNNLQANTKQMVAGERKETMAEINPLHSGKFDALSCPP